MKKLACVFILAVVCKLNAIEFKINDGKVAFAVGTINGKVVWNAAEKKEEIDKFIPTASTPAAVVINFTPTKIEVNLSTCATGSISADYFRALKKDSILSEISEIKRRYDLFKDLDPTGAEVQDYRARYEFLKGFYATLP